MGTRIDHQVDDVERQKADIGWHVVHITDQSDRSEKAQREEYVSEKNPYECITQVACGILTDASRGSKVGECH